MGIRTRPIDQHVGERIRLRRTERGLTQEQLAASARRLLPAGPEVRDRGQPHQRRPHLSRSRASSTSSVGYFFEGLDGDQDCPAAPLEHGGRQRSAIELVRKFAQIQDPEVRAAIAGLVKTIVERDG